MAEESDTIIPIPASLKQKLLFYVTAFFLLVAIFSAFGFLFLVPFIIEPAYTTIKMDFDEEPAQCVTASVQSKRGLTNCSWTSCREGCTREVYECTQIFVNYKHPNIPNSFVLQSTNVVDAPDAAVPDEGDDEDLQVSESRMASVAEYGGDEEFDDFFSAEKNRNLHTPYEEEVGGRPATTKLYKWFYGARLFPNVKGCGYPPYLNCTVFINTYVHVGANFSCYYSRTDPSLVVSELDMQRVHQHLICALLVPVASFVLSIVYLTFAYLYIYSDPKGKPRRKQPSTTAFEGPVTSNIVQVTPLALSTPLAPPTSGILTPVSDMYQEDDLNSFGHQYKYAMTDDMLLSRDSLDSLAFNYSSSMNGNLNKMMTTCILTPPGPIAEL